MLNPVHLRTLGAVLRTGSFAAAAKELGYTSSAVSQQMSALEHDARMTLFERQARSITSTPAATLLADRATEVMALFDGLQDDVRAIAGGQLGTLRIGSFPTASEHLLPGAIAQIASALPGVSIELEEGEPDTLIPLVSDRRIDIALVYEYDLVTRRWPRNVRRTTLLSEDLVLLLPSSHDSDDDIDISEFKDRIWVSTAVGTSGSECLERICAQAGFVPRVDFRTNDYDVVRRFVGAGLGVALVPQLGATEDAQTSLARLSGASPRRHIIAAQRRVGGSPIAAAALEALIKVADQWLIA